MIKRFVDKLFSDPRVRIAYRAILAAGLVVYAADDPFEKGVLYAALWAALETITPLNQLVGLFKKDDTTATP